MRRKKNIEEKPVPTHIESLDTPSKSPALIDFVAYLKKELERGGYARKIGISRANWYRMENGLAPSTKTLRNLIKNCKLDSLLSRLLFSFSGYPNKSPALLEKELTGEKLTGYVQAQESLVKYFLENTRISFIDDLSISWIPAELQTDQYTKEIMRFPDGTEIPCEAYWENSFTQFLTVRKERKEKLFHSGIHTRFLLLDTMFEKSALLEPEALSEQVDEIIRCAQEYKHFIEIRLLSPGPRCPIPPSNFRNWGGKVLSLYSMFYDEFICEEYEKAFFKSCSVCFNEFWMRALDTRTSLERLKMFKERLRQKPSPEMSLTETLAKLQISLVRPQQESLYNGFFYELGQAKTFSVSVYFQEILSFGQAVSWGTTGLESPCNKFYIIWPVLLEIAKRHPQLKLWPDAILQADSRQGGIEGKIDYVGGKRSETLENPCLIITTLQGKDLSLAWPRTLTNMYLAQETNRQNGRKAVCTHGIVTNGENWDFGKLENNKFAIYSVGGFNIFECQQKAKLILGLLDTIFGKCEENCV